MSESVHRAYWQWRRETGGGDWEILILYLDDDAVRLVAHVDYRASRAAREWSLEAARQEERAAFEGIPDGVWEEFRARLG